MAIAAQNLGNAAVLPTFVTSVLFGVANALAVTLQTLNLPAEIFMAPALCGHAARPGGLLQL